MSVGTQPRKANDPFPEEKFLKIPGVVVFTEHRTRLRDGRPAVYDRETLERIAANCNRRIDETGNYAAVCIGHTSPENSDKPLIGFAGPFRVEERNGKAVLVCDFHILRDEVDNLARYPRPSPEVWIPEDGFDPDRIFLDPIAMLGAETPRLDLGMTFLYRAMAGPYLCEKYAAAPAPGNVAVPEFGARKKVRYEKEDSPMPLAKEDIQAILKAIESTDWYSWLRQQMAANAGGEHKEPDGDEGETPPDNTAKADKYEAEDTPPPPKKKRPDDDDLEPDDEPAEDLEDEDTEEPPRKPRKVEEYRCTTHYAKREDVLEAQREIYRLRVELEKEKALRINTERRRILENLARQYVVDVDEEMQSCRYGRMSDEAFRKHCARIERHYRPRPVGLELPMWAEGAAESGDAPELYRKQQETSLHERALAYAKRMIALGKPISYDDALEQVRLGKG